MADLQLKRGAAAAVNATILKGGEPIVDSTNNVLFIGTGGTTVADRFQVGGGITEWGAIAAPAVPTGDIWTDVNNTDWSLVPAVAAQIDPDRPQNILLTEDALISFGNGTEQIWRYMGNKDVSVGIDNSAPGGATYPYYATVAGDYQLTGALTYDDVWYAVDEAAMMAKPAKQGDVCKITTGKVVYKLSTPDPTVLANWEHLGDYNPPSAAVAADEVFTVTTRADMAGIANAVQGDVARVEDSGMAYMLSSAAFATLADWLEIGRPGGINVYDFYSTEAMLADLTIKYPADIMRINFNSGSGGATDHRSRTLVFAGGDDAVIGNYFEQSTNDFGEV